MTYKYEFPKLPDNQRWVVSREMSFVIVKLQEKGRWGWWRTIARSSEWANGGIMALDSCVDHIMKRDYYAKLRKDKEEREAFNRAQIPYGTYGGE